MAFLEMKKAKGGRVWKRADSFTFGTLESLMASYVVGPTSGDYVFRVVTPYRAVYVAFGSSGRLVELYV